MSGFGAISGMNQMLRNNAKLLRKRKPLKGLREIIKTSNSPLTYKNSDKAYIKTLRKKLKKETRIDKIKSFIVLSIVSTGILYTMLQILI